MVNCRNTRAVDPPGVGCQSGGMGTTGEQRRVRVAMTCVFYSSGVGFGVWAASVARLRELWGLSDGQLGIVLFALAVGAVAAMPVAGVMAARLGTVRTTVASGVAVAVLLPIPALVPGWSALLAAAVTLGMASGAIDVTMNAHAAEVEREAGRAIMSSFHAGWSLGGLSGAALAGLFAYAGVGLAATLALVAMLVAATALAGLTLREGSGPVGDGLVWPGRAMLGLGALACLCFVAEGAVGDWTGVYLRMDLGVSAAVASTSYAAYSAAMVLGRLFGDRVVRRLGPALVIVLSGAMAAAGFGLGLAVPVPAVAIAGFALVGIGLSNVVPVAFSAAGRRGSTGVAMAATMGFGGLLGAPPLIGFVAEAIGLRGALLLVMVGAAGIALLAPAVRVRAPARV